MRRLLVCLSLSLAVLWLTIPTQAWAADAAAPTASEGVVHVLEAEAAPFEGTLYDLQAGTRLLHKLEACNIQEQQFQIQLDSQLALQANDWQLKYDLLESRMQGQTERLTLKLDTAQDIIDMQNTFITKHGKRSLLDEPVIWIGGGVLTGIGVTVLAAWAMGQVTP